MRHRRRRFVAHLLGVEAVAPLVVGVASSSPPSSSGPRVALPSALSAVEAAAASPSSRDELLPSRGRVAAAALPVGECAVASGREGPGARPRARARRGLGRARRVRPRARARALRGPRGRAGHGAASGTREHALSRVRGRASSLCGVVAHLLLRLLLALEVAAAAASRAAVGRPREAAAGRRAAPLLTLLAVGGGRARARGLERLALHGAAAGAGRRLELDDASSGRRRLAGLGRGGSRRVLGHRCCLLPSLSLLLF